MIRYEIEKEINQENKIFAGLTARKLAVMGCAIGGVAVMAAMFHNDLDMVPYLSLPIGALAFLFGWYAPNGMPFERYAIKKIKTIFYGSKKRKYRTSNQYVLMMNHELIRRRAADQGNKTIAKQVKKDAKKHEKEIKKMQKTAACKPVK